MSDTTPITDPAPLVAWRPAEEQNVVTNTVLNGIVIRPALLFGKSGSLLTGIFNEALEAKKEGRKLVYAGIPGGRWALIHTDDLAELYLKVAESSVKLGGLIFDAVNDFSESVEDFLQKLCAVVGVDGHEYREPANGGFDSCPCSSSVLTGFE
jgi:nucleoside-diphosphate-sugar epimerase